MTVEEKDCSIQDGEGLWIKIDLTTDKFKNENPENIIAQIANSELFHKEHRLDRCCLCRHTFANCWCDTRQEREDAFQKLLEYKELYTKLILEHGQVSGQRDKALSDLKKLKEIRENSERKKTNV